MKKNQVLVLVLGLFMGISCAENTSAPIDDGDNNGETSVYVREIQPILNNSCALSGCHSSGSGASGVRLGSYSQTMESVGSRLGRSVIPGNADGSPLVQILERSVNGVSRMPLGGTPLTAQQINTIKAWINGDALPK